MGIAKDSRTPGAVRLIPRAGAKQSFWEARTDLKEVEELGVSHETIRRVTEGIAKEVETEQEAGPLLGDESPVEFEKDDRAYITMDGTSVNTQDGWREVKLGVLHDQLKAKQHYAAMLEPAAGFGLLLLLLRRHAQHLRLGRAAKKVGGGGGGKIFAAP
ncbi:MAG: hypothetical protein ACOC70_02990, partial [bacterium]